MYHQPHPEPAMFLAKNLRELYEKGNETASPRRGTDGSELAVAR